MDETITGTSADFEAVPNRDKNYPNDQYLWERILKDFKDAESYLPEVQRLNYVPYETLPNTPEDVMSI